jgi:hypothetical protein
MKRYKHQLQEMAQIGKINDLVVQVYNDHNPIHFHVIKKDKYEVRISIKSLKIIRYVWQKDNEKITTKEYNKILKWLELPNKKNTKLTNYEAINFAWNIMNN